MDENINKDAGEQTVAAMLADAQPEEETASAETAPMFCGNCGKQLQDDEAFCSGCGTAKDAAAAESAKPAKKAPNKKIAIIAAAAVAVVVIGAIGLFAVGGSGSKTPSFQELYDQNCEKTWAKVGSDGSYLSIDTNPYDKDDGDSRYMYVATQAIEEVNKALGFSDSLYEDMCQTTWSMGKQSESKNGITVTWTYHPDKGLEVTYKKDDSKSK